MNATQSYTAQRVRWWDVVWIMLLAAYMLAGTPLTPFHGDESTLIYMSRDYAYQFIDHDLEKVRYSDPPISLQEQNLRLLNGTISKYAIGLAWHIGGFNISDVNEQWDWGGDWDYNIQVGHMPADDLLHTTRWSSSIMMTASVGVLFAIGWQIGGRWTAFGASLYYALSPGLLINGQRAMMEGSYALFTLLTLLAGMWMVKHGGWRRALLLGLFGGLALASKHTAAFTLVAVFGMVGLVWLIQAVRQRSQLAISNFGNLLGAGIIALLIFYILNPAWWGNPIGRARHVLELREELLTIQVNAFGGYDAVADKIAGFVRQAVIAQPQYYEVNGWQDWIGAEIEAYEASLWHGFNIGATPFGAVGLTMLIVVGAWQLLRHPSPVRWLVSGWALIMVILTLGLTPLEWQRYYLPVYPPIGLLAGLGVETIWRFMTNLIPRPPLHRNGEGEQSIVVR